MRRLLKPHRPGLLDSPGRNLRYAIAFELVVMLLAVVAYLSQGWSLRDAVFMVVTTVYTVGYGEVRPVDTPTLDAITMALVVLGCTGIIFLTGALVQYITTSQQGRGYRRMLRDIEQLQDHVVLCGFGRLGAELARTLAAGRTAFVIVEQDEGRVAQAHALGYPCLHGDATSEPLLLAAGVARASALTAVLSNDALNVFITLSARSLNPGLTIVARGELPSTERKLLQAGANRVVMPTHIGAERIADLILYEASASRLEHLEQTTGVQRALRLFGLEVEVAAVAPGSRAAGQAVAQIEREARGAFLLVQLNRQDGSILPSPAPEDVVAGGDSVVLLGRPNRAGTVSGLFDGTPAVPVAGA